MRAVHGYFARLRFEHPALYADYVAQVVVLFERGVVILAHVVAADVNLYEPVAVGNVRKRSLAHDTARHKSARKTDLLALVFFEIVYNFRGIGGNVVPDFNERVVALLGKLLQFFPAYPRLLGKFFLGRFRQRYVLFHKISLRILRNFKYFKGISRAVGAGNRYLVAHLSAKKRSPHGRID